MMKVLVIGAMLIAIAGCAQVGNPAVSIGAYESFRENVTTRSEVITALGEPNSETHTTEGQTMYMWTFGSSTMGKAEGRSIMLQFNDDNVLEKKTYSSTKM